MESQVIRRFSPVQDSVSKHYYFWTGYTVSIFLKQLFLLFIVRESWIVACEIFCHTVRTWCPMAWDLNSSTRDQTHPLYCQGSYLTTRPLKITLLLFWWSIYTLFLDWHLLVILPWKTYGRQGMPDLWSGRGSLVFLSFSDDVWRRRKGVWEMAEHPCRKAVGYKGKRSATGRIHIRLE